jgi:hypothetical protein
MLKVFVKIFLLRFSDKKHKLNGILECSHVDRYAFSLSIPHFMKCTQIQQWSAFILKQKTSSTLPDQIKNTTRFDTLLFTNITAWHKNPYDITSTRITKVSLEMFMNSQKR